MYYWRWVLRILEGLAFVAGLVLPRRAAGKRRSRPIQVGRRQGDSTIPRPVTLAPASEGRSSPPAADTVSPSPSRSVEERLDSTSVSSDGTQTGSHTVAVLETDEPWADASGEPMPAEGSAGEPPEQVSSAAGQKKEFETEEVLTRASSGNGQQAKEGQEAEHLSGGITPPDSIQEVHILLDASAKDNIERGEPDDAAVALGELLATAFTETEADNASVVAPAADSVASPGAISRPVDSFESEAPAGDLLDIDRPASGEPDDGSAEIDDRSAGAAQLPDEDSITSEEEAVALSSIEGGLPYPAASETRSGQQTLLEPDSPPSDAHGTGQTVLPAPQRPSRRRIAPERRGGGRFTQESPAGSAPAERERRLSGRKPGLVCWDDAARGMWMIGVEPPETLDDEIEAVARQGEEPLEEDLEGSRRRWKLTGLSLPVTVEWEEGDGSWISLAPLEPVNECLLFKLTQCSQRAEGRRVRALTTGSYLLTVPPGAEVKFPPDFSPSDQPLSLSGWRGYLLLDAARFASSSIQVKLANGAAQYLRGGCPYFYLKGFEGSDALLERYGPLFHSELPHLTTGSASNWQQIGTVVVGQEGPGRNKWRTHFTPDPEASSQPLPQQIDELGSGWFFVRLYDSNDDLFESHQFRYVRDLKGVSLDPADPLLPGPDGHKPVSILLQREGDLRVRLEDGAEHLLMESSDEGPRITVPPLLELKEVHLSVVCGNGWEVPVCLPIQRLWWRLEQGGGSPEWTDRPVTMTQSLLRSARDVRILLQIPEGARDLELKAGFDEASALAVTRAGGEAAIALADYAGHPVLGRLEEIRLSLWIRKDGTRVGEIPLLLSPLRLACRFCQERFESWEGLERHLRKDHLCEHNADMLGLFSRDVPYTELALHQGLPVQLYYRCKYRGDNSQECDKIIPVCREHNPTTEFSHHWQSEHVGDPQERMEVLSAEEVKERFMPELRIQRQCQICEQLFYTDKTEELERHFSCAVISDAVRRKFFHVL